MVELKRVTSRGKQRLKMAGLKLSKQAAVAWCAITILFVAAALAAHKIDEREVMRACFAKQIDLCGDLLCESDDDAEATLQSMRYILEDCMDNPDSIDRRYYDKQEQKRIFN